MCPQCRSRFTKTFYLDLFPRLACVQDAEMDAICLDCGHLFDWATSSMECTDCQRVLPAMTMALDQRCPECHTADCRHCRFEQCMGNPFPYWEPHD